MPAPTKPAPTKPVLKPTVTKDPVPAPKPIAKVAAKAPVRKDEVKAAKALKIPAVKVEAEIDEILQIPRRNISGFRWVAIDVLREMWNGPETDETSMAERCIELAAERNAPKQIDVESWIKQLRTLRAWLRTLKHPMPGDVRAEKSQEEKDAMSNRLKMGRAKKAALRELEDDSSEVTEEE